MTIPKKSLGPLRKTTIPEKPISMEQLHSIVPREPEQKKKTISFFVNAFIIKFVLWYSVFSLTEWSLNITNWHNYTRFIFAILILADYLVAASRKIKDSNR